MLLLLKEWERPTLSLMYETFCPDVDKRGCMSTSTAETQVKEILDEYLADKDLETYRIVYKKEGKDWVLRIFLDKPADSEQEYVSIEECEEVNRFLSDRLDELDIIDRSYNLEVSSPGLDRELIKDSDYVRFSGREVEVRTYEPVNGAKNFEGTLVGKEDGIVTINVGGGDVGIPSDKISKINLAVVF